MGTDDPVELPPLPGVTFRDPALLERALTHRSTEGADNERLEFLGDAVLGLAVAARLHERSEPSIGEGALTLARARVVSRQPLADAARALGLDAHVRLGPGEARAGGAQKDRILCGVYEAVIGALFLDAGYAAAARRTPRTSSRSSPRSRGSSSPSTPSLRRTARPTRGPSRSGSGSAR